MKRLLVVSLVLLVLSGCSGVWMNSTYSSLLDRTAAVSAETAARADAGKLTPDEMKQALADQAVVWQRFRDARDGRDSK